MHGAPIPYDEIDAGIVGVVRLINSGGFMTTASCEGGDGHRFLRPTVRVASQGDLDETRKALCCWLIENGARGFTASTVLLYQRSGTPEPYSYVEIEFWSQATLRYVVF